MKKILFVIDTMGYGGAEKALVNLVNNMDKTKYDITVLSMFKFGNNSKKLDKSIKYKYVLRNYFRGNSIVISLIPKWLLYKFFIREKYDTIIAYIEGSATRVVSGCNNLGTKIFAWLHVDIPDSNRLYRSYTGKKGCIKAYRKFDGIVGVSNKVIESFIKHTGIVDKVHVLYNTINYKEILNSSKEPFMFDNDMINAVSVARLVPQKGFIRLLEAHKRVIEEGYIYHLTIIGDGSERKKLENFILVNNLEKYTKIMGYADNPYKYVRSADFFVCSSYTEGYSTAVTEAAIIGTPIITTDCSGMNEILDEEKGGIIVENSIEGIYSGIKRVLKDPNILQEIREKNKSLSEKFSTNKTVKEVESLIDGI